MSADCASPPSRLSGIGSVRRSYPGHTSSCSVAQTFVICVVFHAPSLPFLLVQMGACCSRVVLGTRVRMLTCLSLPTIAEVKAIGVPPVVVVDTTGA